MERNISFRAYDGEIMLFYEPQTTEEYDSEWVDFFFKKCTVMQFTGIHDKDGKPIYEGDICEVSYYNHSSPNTKIIQELVFESGCFILRAKNYIGLELEDSKLYVPLYWCYPPNQIKIIGNIHETPEILNEKIQH
jgi:uncharacterized phage protein (TIGR01671 family)